MQVALLPYCSPQCPCEWPRGYSQCLRKGRLDSKLLAIIRALHEVIIFGSQLRQLVFSFCLCTFSLVEILSVEKIEFMFTFWAGCGWVERLHAFESCS